MSGNVSEWCQDVCVDIDKVPLDGTPSVGPGDERRLRGGCHNNWSLPPNPRRKSIGVWRGSSGAALVRQPGRMLQYSRDVFD